MFTVDSVLFLATVVRGRMVSLTEDGEIVEGEEISADKMGYKVRVMAAEALLNRAWGRPAMHVEMGGKGVLEMVFSKARTHDPLAVPPGVNTVPSRVALSPRLHADT